MFRKTGFNLMFRCKYTKWHVEKTYNNKSYSIHLEAVVSNPNPIQKYSKGAMWNSTKGITIMAETTTFTLSTTLTNTKKKTAWQNIL